MANNNFDENMRKIMAIADQESQKQHSGKALQEPRIDMEGFLKAQFDDGPIQEGPTTNSRNQKGLTAKVLKAMALQTVGDTEAFGYYVAAELRSIYPQKARYVKRKLAEHLLIFLDATSDWEPISTLHDHRQTAPSHRQDNRSKSNSK